MAVGRSTVRVYSEYCKGCQAVSSSWTEHSAIALALASLPRDDGSVVRQSVACRLYLLNDPSNPTNPHIMNRW